MPVQGQGISVAQLLANNARNKNIAAVYDASAVKPYTDLLAQGAKDNDDYFARLREQQAIDEDSINRVIEDAPVRYKELAEENTLHLRDMVADSVRKGKTNDPKYRKEFARELNKIQKYSYAAQNASGVLAEAKKVIDDDPYVDKAKAYALIDKFGQGDIENLNLADVLEKVGGDPTIRDYDQYLTDKLKNLPKEQSNITTEDSRYMTDQMVTYPSKFARVDPETNKVVFDIPDQSADDLWDSYDTWAKKDVAQRAREKRGLVRDLLQKEKDGAITDEEQNVLDDMDISVYESGSTQDQIRDVIKSDVESSLDVKYGNLKRTAKRQPPKGSTSKPTVAEKKEKVLKDFVVEYPKLVAKDPEAYKGDLERRMSSMGLEKEIGKDFKIKDAGNNKWEINYMARNPLYEMSDSQGWFQAPPIVVEDVTDPAALEDVLRSVLLPYSTEGLKHKKKVDDKMKKEPKSESGKKGKINLDFNKPKVGIVESIKEGLKNIFTSDKDGQTE